MLSGVKRSRNILSNSRPLVVRNHHNSLKGLVGLIAPILFAWVKHINSSSRRIASGGLTDTQPRSMQFCGDLPLLMRPCWYPLRPVVTVETIVTAEMVTINNRPRRRIGLNGHKGLNKTNSIHPACPSSGWRLYLYSTNFYDWANIALLEIILRENLHIEIKSVTFV